MRRSVTAMCGILMISLFPALAWAADGTTSPATPETPKKVVEMDKAYPGLASGVLVYAHLADLPEGIVLRAGSVVLTTDDLAKAVKDAPERLQEQLRKNAFFILEQLATPQILTFAARAEAARTNPQVATLTDKEVMDAYAKKLLAEVKVADEEVRAFYDQNKAMFGAATFDAVKGQVAPYLLQQKQKEAVTKHIRELGQKVTIEVSAPWVKEQSVLARDNPVDKARLSKRPSMVDFGRDGCTPCDMMAPILVTLKKKYEGKANVLFVHTGEEEVLAMRYAIDVVPIQVFFDATGKEVFRHTGFFPQDEIEKKLAAMGVK